MMVYYLWALAEKGLSVVPFGQHIYSGLGYLAYKNKRGKSNAFYTSFRLTRAGKELIPPAGTVLDVGTGWYHHDAFLLHLVGDYTIYLFDVEDKARLAYIKNYLGHLLGNIDRIVAELDIDPETARTKIERLLRLRSRREIYDACNFISIIPDDASKPFLPERSIDFMVSNCVINHIPPKLLVPELIALRNMLKNDGSMYFLVGHDDHWAFHDHSANQFNYYRYSDRYYRLFFETKFEFQNRMVKQEWMEVFDRCGLRVDDYYAHITDQSREQIRRLPHIDARFAKYPLEELAIIYSYVLLRKVDGAGGRHRESAGAQPRAADSARISP